MFGISFAIFAFNFVYVLDVSLAIIMWIDFFKINSVNFCLQNILYPFVVITDIFVFGFILFFLLAWPYFMYLFSLIPLHLLSHFLLLLFGIFAYFSTISNR